MKLFCKFEIFQDKNTMNKYSKNLPKSFSKPSQFRALWPLMKAPATSQGAGDIPWSYHRHSGLNQTRLAPDPPCPETDPSRCQGRARHPWMGWVSICPTGCPLPLSAAAACWLPGVPHCHQSPPTGFSSSRKCQLKLPGWSN